MLYIKILTTGHYHLEAMEPFLLWLQLSYESLPWTHHSLSKPSSLCFLSQYMIPPTGTKAYSWGPHFPSVIMSCSITLSLTYHFFFILAVHRCGPILLIRSLSQLINPPPHQQSSVPTIFFSPQRRQNDSFMMQIRSFYSSTKSFNAFYL